MSSPPAGWYPDPYDGAQVRYWDGTAWSESVSPAATPAQVAPPPVQDPTWEAPLPGPAGGQYPGQSWEAAPGPAGGQYPGQSWEAPPYQAAPYESGPALGHGYGPIGDWLSASFGTLFRRIGPVVTLAIVVPAAGFVAVAVLVGLSISQLSIDNSGADPQFEGFSGGLVALTILAYLAALILALAGWIGANHQLYTAHVGRPATIGRSLSVGFRRVPRSILWFIVAYVAAVLVVAAIGLGLALVALVGEDSAGLAALLAVVVFVGSFLGSIWLGVRLAFFGTALAVGPGGLNPFSASWAITDRRFWATFGRFVILWLLSSVIVFVIYIVLAALVLGAFDFSSSGDLLVDGRPAGELDRIDLGDILPGIGWFVAFITIAATGMVFVQALAMSATARLYAEAGGPGEV